MAIVIDAQGNLIDTTGRIDFSGEEFESALTQDVPDTADSPYANLLGLPATQDMGFLYGVPQRADDQGYLTGLPGTADDVFPFQPPGTADDRIANLSGVPGTADDVFPFAAANRLQGLDLNRFKGIGSLGVANEEDEEQVEYLGSEPSGIKKLLQYLPFVGDKSLSGGLLRGLIPKQDPRAINMRNFYGSRYGLTPTGSLASGIMAGYNPISGGLLNMITGGKFGRPTNYGLATAARDRINRIANRKIAQTDASRAKIAELQKFARADEISRARQAAPDVYKAAESQGFIDSSGGFKSAGTNEAFSNKTGRGRTGY